MWFGNITKAKLARLVKTAMGNIGKIEYQTLESSYEHSVLKEVTKILSAPSHSLYPEYELLSSGRSYRCPVCRCIRFKKTFVLTSIRLLNMSFIYVTLVGYDCYCGLECWFLSCLVDLYYVM